MKLKKVFSNEMMKTTVDNTYNGLAKAIDEITNAKSLIKLDSNDFADILKIKGETVVITSEAATSEPVDFSVLCKEIRNRIKEFIDDKSIRSVLYISHPENYTLMMDDMKMLDIIFDIPSMEEVSIKWGIGENNNNTVKLIVILKLAE